MRIKIKLTINTRGAFYETRINSVSKNSSYYDRNSSSCFMHIWAAYVS